MPTGVISDPFGTNGLATPQIQGQIVDTFIASEDITKYDLCALTMATDGVLRVARADTDTHDPAVKVVAALETVASGASGLFVVGGPALITTPATGPSASEVLILTNAAGTGDGAAADATTVAGDTHGVFLTDEVGTDNRSWVWIYY
jgi:hypothetical protein